MLIREEFKKKKKEKKMYICSVLFTLQRDGQLHNVKY